jgi:aspartyl-tRNA(Asn)/glutamyl-tRNA(Gln) amidotransferase subunit B
MEIRGKNFVWEYVIGLEVHAQISSQSKLFSSAANCFDAPPNTQVSFIDAAFPGTLPVLNWVCIEQGAKSGLGINAKINLFSAFDRKNYFYPDLPRGYQISQFYHPIAENGWIDIVDEEGKMKRIGITRLHLEQDAGKSLHDHSHGYTCIDLNRAGVPLMEIVSEPDIRSPFEAGQYLKKLRSILRYIGSCNGDMEKGELRCDANVSVRKKGEKEFGTRCEIKNLNSIRHVMKAIEFEGKRQVQSLEKGVSIKQATMLFSPESGETKVMRLKEDAQDYRYFPEPDLPPIFLTKEQIESIATSLPELPEAKILRYSNSLLVNETDARVIAADKEIALYFEEVIALGIRPQVAANWITGILFSLLKEHNCEISECRVNSKDLAKLISLVEEERISGKAAKIVCAAMFESNKDIDLIIEQMDLTQITDPNRIEQIVDQVLKIEEETATAYRSGKHKVFNFLVSAVLKHSSGKASPSLVQEILRKKLES